MDIKLFEYIKKFVHLYQRNKSDYIQIRKMECTYEFGFQKIWKIPSMPVIFVISCRASTIKRNIYINGSNNKLD